MGRCATDDAIRVGRAHTTRQGWGEDQLEWLLEGGYAVSELVAEMASVRTLLLWGRQDRVLPPPENVPRFLDALGPAATFRWVEDCGHVPHLEQPDATAAAIAGFVRGEPIAGDADASQLRGGGGGGGPLGDVKKRFGL